MDLYTPVVQDCHMCIRSNGGKVLLAWQSCLTGHLSIIAWLGGSKNEMRQPLTPGDRPDCIGLYLCGERPELDIGSILDEARVAVLPFLGHI